MAEYIDRNELIKNLKRFAPEHYSALVNNLIKKQPTADVAEVRDCEKCKYYHRTYANYPCNACRNCYTDKFEAKMDGRSEHNG